MRRLSFLSFPFLFLIYFLTDNLFNYHKNPLDSQMIVLANDFCSKENNHLVLSVFKNPLFVASVDFDCPVALQNVSLLGSAPYCETGL